MFRNTYEPRTHLQYMFQTKICPVKRGHDEVETARQLVKTLGCGACQSRSFGVLVCFAAGNRLPPDALISKGKRTQTSLLYHGKGRSCEGLLIVAARASRPSRLLYLLK